MNARGISVFYGAIDEETALAEIRPPVGAQVIVGNFVIARQLKVLDLTALPHITLDGSVFDPAYATELERVTFLRNLATMLTRPVMPDDEVFDYLPTQAIADFLSTESAFAFDGIIFPSAQVEGEKPNIVLFHKSSRVEEMKLPMGTTSDVQLWGYEESGPYRDYQVCERFPPINKTENTAPIKEVEDELLPIIEDSQGSICGDDRPITLKLNEESVKVHLINAVKIISDSYSVRRLRLSNSPITDD